MPIGHAGRPFCPLRSLYAAMPALAATVYSLVTDVRYPVLILFPIIAERSKDADYFHRLDYSVSGWTTVAPYSMAHSCDSRCTAASAKQPSQGRLPAWRSNRRQTTSQVAPLAASQALSDMQDGGADVQDDVLLNASIFEWPDPGSCSSSSFAVIRRPAADRPKNRWVRASVFFGRGSAHLELTTIRR